MKCDIKDQLKSIFSIIMLTFFSSSFWAQTQMDLPVTFEGTSINYSLIGFGGADSSYIVVDPTNGANTVVRVYKNNTAQLWAGTTVTDSASLGFINPIPFAPGSTVMSVRVYSPDAGIPVRLKVEDHTNPAVSVETEALTTVANAWETLIFDFSNEVPGTAVLNMTNSYNKASIFFNFGTDGATAGAKTYYFDDLEFVPGPPPTLAQMDLPVDFEGTTTNYSLVGFGGAEASTIEADPVNAANTVVKVIKTNTAQLWAGTTVTDSANVGFINPVPFSVGSTIMSVKVYSPDAGIPVRLKLEDHTNNTITVESEGITTVANAWETMVFDFAIEVPGTPVLNMANAYDLASIFFNFGTDGATAGTKTYYFDDIEFGAGSPPSLAQMDLPVDFEGTTTNYSLIGFGGAEASTIEADPVNAANTAVKVIKSNTAQLWAGTTVTDSSGIGFINPVPFAVGATSMTIMVYSPDAGIPVRLKVEDHTNPTISVETEALTTMANTWEMLTFDFANEASGTAALNMTNSYNKASVFFNFGTDGATAGTKTYYFDDIEFVPPAPPALAQMDLPVDFEGTTTNYSLVGFGGAEAATLEPDPVNAANTVVQVIKTNTAQLWAGTTVTDSANIGFLNPVPFATGLTSMTVKIYSPDAGIPIRLKLEDHTNPTISVETETMTTVANAWETLTFDFSNEVSGSAALNMANSYNMASIFFNFGTDGATAGTKTYFFDDMEFVATPPLAQMDLPVDFEGTTTNYSLVGFGGAEASTLEADPVNAANTVVQVIKTNTAQLWAGTTVTDSASIGFINPVPFATGFTSMTVKVYSPDAGIPVRLKLEDHTNATISVETEAMTTVANAWETLTFDFANEASGTAALNMANSYNMASIFFNFGTDGATAGTKTYYFDDLEFVGLPVLAQMDLPVDFEGTTINYSLVGFGGAEAATIEADPVNAANTVAKVIKNASAQLWAGTTVTDSSNIGFLNPVPFGVNATSMTVKVYSPDAGIPVRLKLEDHTNNTITVETEAMTTVANAWETLTFDFANEVPGTAVLNMANAYNMASIFFNFGTDGATAGTKTYYFDDMEFVPAPPLAQMDLPVDFEGTTTNYSLVGFGGAEASTIEADPVNAANTVVKVIKNASAQLWAGTTVTDSANIGFINPVPFAVNATSMTVKVYSPDAGIPVRLKVEDHTNPTITVETEAMTTVANAWETLTFNFANEASGTAPLNMANNYNKASIFFNFGTDGATAGSKTYYFDDMEFVPAPAIATMDLTVFVEGYYISGSTPPAMNPVLFNNETFGGPVTPSSTDVTQVIVELWPNASGAVYSASGILASDGSLSVDFPATAIGNAYWLSLTTSNTLRTFSSSALTIAATNSYNFSNAVTQAATDGSTDAMATLAPGLFGLRSGDINQDEFVDGSDYSVFESEVPLTLINFNMASDLNGDGFVDGSDYPILDFNSATGFYAQYPSFL